MEVNDIFQNVFIDDDGREFKIKSANDHLNVIIDGKQYFDFDVPFKLVNGVRHFLGIYDCIQCIDIELNIYYSSEEHKWIAMIGVINANLGMLK